MKNLGFIYASLLGVALVACQSVGTDELLYPSAQESYVTESVLVGTFEPGVTYCGTPMVQTLWAGQYIDAGTVTAYNDESMLYVTMYSTYGFQQVAENIKMWVGTDIMLMPQTNDGTPINGQFPYKLTVTNGNSGTLAVPLENIPFYDASVCGVQSLIIVIHGDVLASEDGTNISGETAYGGDQSGTSSRWWYYFTFTPQCCETPPPPVDGTHETAFAKFDKFGDYGSGFVFTKNRKSNPENYQTLGLTMNRWGWAGNVTMDGTYNFPMYAGAGLNNVTNGTLVGVVSVVRFGDYLTVSYETNMGYSMSEIHVYASDFSPNTIAPGQYGHTAYFGDMPEEYLSGYNADFTVPDTNNDGIWIIAHAVVYGEY